MSRSTAIRSSVRAVGPRSSRSPRSWARVQPAPVAGGGPHVPAARPPSWSSPPPRDRGGLLEVAVRPRDQQLVLDRAPEALGEARSGAARPAPRARARPAPTPRPWPPRPAGPPRRPRRAAGRPGRGRGPAARRPRASSYRPSEARRTSTRQARSTSSAAAASSSVEVLGRGGRPGERVQRGGAVLGLVGAGGGDLGQPGQPAGDQHAGAPLLGGAQREVEERLDHAGARLGGQHQQHAVEEVAGRELALGEHVPGGADGDGAVDGVGQPRGVVQQHLERALVGAHRGEGQVALVEQVQVGVRQVGEVRRGAGRLDPLLADPLERRRGSARRSRSGARAAAARRRRGWR